MPPRTSSLHALADDAFRRKRHPPQKIGERMPGEIHTEEELTAAEPRDRTGRVLLVPRQAEALLQRMIPLRPRDVAGVIEFVRHVFLGDEIAVAISRQSDILKAEC